jgi:hypothetical protein
VPVLEAVFEQMLYVDQHFLSKVSARESAVEQTTLSRGLSYAISPQSV